MNIKELKNTVKELNYGAKYFKLDFIHGSIYKLVQEGFITESEGSDMLDDIIKYGTTYSYKAFLK